MIPRSAFVPAVAAFTAITLLTAAASHLCLWAEFHSAIWIREAHPPLPPMTEALRAGYPVVWVLPLFTIVAGIWLGREDVIAAASVSWYLAGVLVALFSWGLWVFLAFYFVYAQRDHYLMPMVVP